MDGFIDEGSPEKLLLPSGKIPTLPPDFKISKICLTVSASTLDFVIGMGLTKALISFPAFRLETWSLITKYRWSLKQAETKNAS